MNKVKNSICAFLIILIILAISAIQAFAAGPIDVEQTVTLHISYMDGATEISNARFSIYQVADVDEYAHMTLTEQFEKYKNNVSGLSDLDYLIQEEWLALASTLRGYVLRDNLISVAEGTTDSNGDLTVHDLKAGLYLIIGNRVTTDEDYTYTSVPFMVFLPGEDALNNDWDYEITVAPKFTKEYNPPEEDDEYITRKVLKIWDDSGYETIRPSEVIVQLLRDGKVYDTQTLNNDNNWYYAWDNLEAEYEWTVVEKELPDYALTIVQNGITFTITNKYVVPVTAGNPPVQKRITGDTPKSASTFTFVMTAKEDYFPMPEGSIGNVKEISITGAGSVEFGEIIFTKPGTYTYTISEKNTGVEGYTYDTTVYTVIYEVKQENGELSTQMTILDGESNIVEAIEFTNNYKPIDDTKTPDETLPQTGTMWWPVPVLLFAGLAFVMAGVIFQRKSNG